jgi:hypothetical protein
LAALVRPEGAILLLLMTAGFCVALPLGAALRLGLTVAAVFAALGGGYFLWRWEHFGHPLPNPYYRRGSWHLDAGKALASVRRATVLSWPFLLAATPALGSPRTWRLAIGFAIPWLGFALVWGLFSDAMNFARRYQYPLLPLAALSWYPLLRALPWQTVFPLPRGWKRASLAGLGVAAVGAVLLSQVFLSQSIRRVREGNYDMGLLLHRYADRGYTLATTEAGLLALYSQWRTLDTWGLNDAGISRRGRLTDDDLERYRPAVVMWHDYASPAKPPPARRADPWSVMIETLQRYVDRHGFVLAAAFGTEPDESHYYWVAADLPDCEELVSEIRRLDYPWPRGGARARDLAAGHEGRGCATVPRHRD